MHSVGERRGGQQRTGKDIVDTTTKPNPNNFKVEMCWETEQHKKRKQDTENKDKDGFPGDHIARKRQEDNKGIGNRQ